MAIAGFGRSKLPYGMFDLDRTAKEARRLGKCENIYHRGQELAWDGRDILGEQLAKHGGVHLAEPQRGALERIFAIIMWGEMAAWKISATVASAWALIAWAVLAGGSSTRGVWAWGDPVPIIRASSEIGTCMACASSDEFSKELLNRCSILQH